VKLLSEDCPFATLDAPHGSPCAPEVLGGGGGHGDDAGAAGADQAMMTVMHNTRQRHCLRERERGGGGGYGANAREARADQAMMHLRQQTYYPRIAFRGPCCAHGWSNLNCDPRHTAVPQCLTFLGSPRRGCRLLHNPTVAPRVSGSPRARTVARYLYNTSLGRVPPRPSLLTLAPHPCLQLLSARARHTALAPALTSR
jgi:hypothetical protein